MDGNRFDSLARTLGSGQSRRGVLKALGAAALGMAGLAGLKGVSEAAPTNANGGNSACAQFCAAVFGADTTAAGQCTSDAAHGAGMCSSCGPAAANTGLTLCGQTCVNEQTDPTNCGTCGTLCLNPANGSSTCSGGGCVVTCNDDFEPDGVGGCQAVSACGVCPSFSTPDGDCYWLADSSGFGGSIPNCWYPTDFLFEKPFNQAECAGANTCQFGYGGCYKWSTSSC